MLIVAGDPGVSLRRGRVAPSMAPARTFLVLGAAVT
jgi:hypothetical protein